MVFSSLQSFFLLHNADPTIHIQGTQSEVSQSCLQNSTMTTALSSNSLVILIEFHFRCAINDITDVTSSSAKSKNKTL